MLGWVKVHRSILDHWIWQDEKYFRWWMTILLNVNHSETKFPVSDEIYICKSGESFKSIAEWTRLFRCAKKTTIRFFKMLEKDEMIITKIVGKGNRRKHLLTVVNWKEYQQTETEDYTEKKPETTPKGNPNVTPNKNDKNVKNEKNVLLSKVDSATLDSPEKEYFEIAFSFWKMFRQNLIELNISTSEIDEAKYKTWVDPIRLLIEKDKKMVEEIREVYSFIMVDEFWRAQIRSTAKLRKPDDNGESYFSKLLFKSRNGKNLGNNKKGSEIEKTIEELIANINETQG